MCCGCYERAILPTLQETAISNRYKAYNNNFTNLSGIIYNIVLLQTNNLQYVQES